jgi:uncharacterized membrane protein
MSELLIATLLFMCFGFTMSYYFNVAQRKTLWFSYMIIVLVLLELYNRGVL